MDELKVAAYRYEAIVCTTGCRFQGFEKRQVLSEIIFLSSMPTGIANCLAGRRCGKLLRKFTAQGDLTWPQLRHRYTRKGKKSLLRTDACRCRLTRSYRSSKETVSVPTSGGLPGRCWTPRSPRLITANGKSTGWKSMPGEKANELTGSWLPDETLDRCPGIPGRHQGSPDHAHRRRYPFPERRPAPDPRPLRLPAPGTLVQRRAFADEKPAGRGHGHLPGKTPRTSTPASSSNRGRKTTGSFSNS